MNITKGLIIEEPWIGYILDGSKTWEMRSQAASFRGWFGLIRKGSGAIFGVARLVESGPPLTDDDMIGSYDKHRIPEASIRSGQVAKWRFPWKLSEVRSLSAPVSYRHRSGAVTWVQLDPEVTEAVACALRSGSGAHLGMDQEDMDNPRQVVFSSLEVTREGLLPYVTGAALKAFGPQWEAQVALAFRHWRAGPDGRYYFDTQKLLQVMDRFWNELFRSSLDRSHRSIVNELVDVRNRVAHDAPISDEDAERALDSMRRLLIAVGATEASEKVSREREAILRARYGHTEAPQESGSQQISAPHGGQPPHPADGERNQDSERDAESGGDFPKLIGEIAITQGNIDHNHLYLRSVFDRFPADAKGGSNKASAAKQTLTVSWGGPEPVQTDLDSEKKFFRARGWIGAFYKLNNARAGDRVRIEETAPYRYRVILVR